MNTRVTATIGGQAHGLQFHSAHVQQRLFAPCRLQLELGFGEQEVDSVINKAMSTWLGEELVLTIKDELNKDTEKKYTGTITSVSLSSVALILEAQSKDHLLTVGRKHKTFSELQINDMVNQVVQSGGLQCDVTGADSSKKFHFFQQYDETDYEFLKRLAQYDGCVMFHDGEKFVYAKSLGGRKNVKLGLEEVDNVTLGCTLDITKWKGSYYNPEKHLDPGGGLGQSVKDSVRSSDALVSKVHKQSEKVFGGTTEEVFHTALMTQTDIDRYVSVRDRQTAGGLVKVEGETNHPMVAIGRTITCESHPILKHPVVVIDLQASFTGNVYSASFVGVPENTVVAEPEPDEHQHAAHLQPAAVVDNKDPEKMGRVKIRYNWSNQDQTFWARVVNVGAGGEAHGTHFTPRVGDQVLIGFENGDPSLPIVIGALYHSEKKPKFVTDNGTEEVLVSKTPISTIRILEKQGSEEVLVSMKDTKNVIRMELKGPKITVESVDGTVYVHSKKIQVMADEKIEMSAKDIEISASQNLTTTVGKDLSLTVSGNAKESVSSDKQVTVGKNSTESVAADKGITAGKNATVKAGANAEVTGTAGVKISGTKVESSAAALNTIKGAMVQIN